MIATIFDCETTGLVENRTLRLGAQPHVIEFYACVVNLKTVLIKSELNLLIKPPSPELVTDEITRITGLTYDEHLKDALPFEKVADKIVSMIEKSKVVIAHNASFDKDMLEIEAERLGRKIKWPRLVCTVEATLHHKGYRLNLGALHDSLFKEKFEGAHRAKTDVMALLRCCVELHKRGDL